MNVLYVHVAFEVVCETHVIFNTLANFIEQALSNYRLCDQLMDYRKSAGKWRFKRLQILLRFASLRFAQKLIV